MAVQSIAVPPDPKRDARALVLSGHAASWPKHTLKIAWGAFEAGTVFRRVTGSKGQRYFVNAVACQCPDYAEAGFICKHVRAVVLWEQQVAAPAPKARASYAELFPACSCGDVADSRDGLCDRCASDREWDLKRQGAAIAHQQIVAGLIFADALNPLAE